MATLTIWYGGKAPMRAVGANQGKLLHFAEKYPGWHTLAKDRATQRAAKSLECKGYLEIVDDQFRITYPR